jgi:hypothetical protein
MARFLQFKLMSATLAAAALAFSAKAQPSPAASATEKPVSPRATSAAAAQKSEDAPAPSRPRAISGSVAAQLAASMPKYTPPPAQPEPKTEEEPIDLREIDRPKNSIIRLPKYIVQEAKPPVFTERVIHTQKGLADLAVRRYLSEADRALNRFTIPLFGSSSEARALAMYAEDERLQNMNDLADDAELVSASDKAAGLYVKREADKTFMRTGDFGWSGGGPK